MKKSKGYFTCLFEGKTEVDGVDCTSNIRDSKDFEGKTSAYPTCHLKVDRVDSNELTSTCDYPTVYPYYSQENRRNTSETAASTPPTSAYPCKVKHSNSDTILELNDKLSTYDSVLKYKGYYNERAAIFQYEGGMSISEAEYHAYLETLKEFMDCEHPEISVLFESIIYSGHN